MSDAKRDSNMIPTMLGVSSVDDTTPISARVGATSKGQYVEIVDSSGNSVSVGGGTQYAEGDTAATATGTAVVWKDAGNTMRVVTAAKPLPVSATLDTTGLATSAKQDTIDTSINTLLKPASTLTAVTTVTTVSTLTGSGIAHDGVDSGNPHKIGFKAYSPDGTAPGTAVAELDRTDAKSDLDGRQFVNGEHPMWWSYHEDSSSALTDATVQAAPGAGFQIVVTEIMVSTGAATALNVFFEEGSTKVLGPWYLEAVAGRGLFWKGNKHITANTALTITTSAAIAHGIDIQGFIQKV